MLLLKSWLFLFIAISFGVAGTVSLKLSHGLKRIRLVFCLLLFYAISLSAMTLAIQGIDISIVYAIWSGLGTVFITLIGVWVFDETLSSIQVVSLSLIICGVVGIHLANAF